MDSNVPEIGIRTGESASEGRRYRDGKETLSRTAPSPPLASAPRIVGQTAMAAAIRDFAWEGTPLGPAERWPAELVTTVNLMIASPIPMQLFWGVDFTTIYNDGLVPFMAGKHPQALGESARTVWAEAWSAVGEQLERVYREGGHVSFDHVFLPLLLNGVLEDMYWDYTYMPVYGSDGKVAGVLDITHNSTETVLAQRALKASEEQAKRVLESIGDAVIVTDPESRITRINHVAEQLTGWARHEALALPLTDVFRIVNESTREAVESPTDKVKRTGTAVGLANHTVLISRNGHEVSIDDSGAPVLDQDGALSEIVLVFRDISERRNAELERDRKAAELEAFLSATADNVVGMDRNWNFSFLNEAAKKTYSAGRDLIGKHVWTEFPNAVYEGSPFVEHYERAMYQRLPGRFEAFYPEPLNLWIRVEVYPAAAEGIVTFSRNVTDEKRSQQALIESEKLAAVGRLAASIAHEINNPLESVTNLLYLAKSAGDPEDLRSYLDLAEVELQRVSVISNQTLRFHKQSTKPAAVSGEQLFESVLSIYQGKLANSRVQIRKNFRTAHTVGCFDGEIRQVLNNLVGNAIDAMQTADGTLHLRVREGRNWQTDERGLVFTVADTGLGMTPDVARRVFEVFFTTKGSSGNGLGLWVSKEIVDRHHGSLRLRSRKGGDTSGTVFALFLPFRPVDL